MSLFPEEDVLTKEIEIWQGFMDKLQSEHDKTILTKLLDDCYKYSVAINDHTKLHPFPSEALIVVLLLSQHRLVCHLKTIIQSKCMDNRDLDE